MIFSYTGRVWEAPYFKSLTTVFITTLFLLLLVSTVSAEMLSVKGDNINIRSGPGIKYPSKWEFSIGFPVRVIQKKGSWIKIIDFENDTGWIHKSLLIDKPKMIVKANKNNDKNINIRLHPSTKSEIIGRAYYGVVFTTVEKKLNWVKVQHQTGLTGWVNSRLLWGY